MTKFNLWIQQTLLSLLKKSKRITLFLFEMVKIRKSLVLERILLPNALKTARLLGFEL
jgi:hypothetical protein